MICKVINVKMTIWKRLWLFCLTISIVLGQDPIVNLPQGRIVGIKVYVENTVAPIEIFFGIPYAMAPIGKLRFSPPEKHVGWRRTFFAHRMPSRCPQPGINSADYSEDCLFLNIWTSRRVDGKLQPVLVILYNESWSRGGINLPCQELAADGVVVVTVSYRLHLLSFFTLKSIAARGNLALLDQYLALVWIRENIAAFGGDPSSVTLAGHSAGANSVLHHILSPRPVGLFHRAVIMSPRDIWKVLDKKMGINNSSGVDSISGDVTKLLGCPKELDREILQCMRAQPVTDILNYEWGDTFLEDYLQPIPDVFLPDSEQYLPASPAKILSTTSYPKIQLDLLIGSTNLEAINLIDNTKYNELIRQHPKTVYEYATTKIVPAILRILSLDRSETLMTLTQAIGWEYWSSNFITKNKEAVEYVASMESSGKWSAGEAMIAAKLADRISRLYVYRFSQPSTIDLTGQHYNNFTGAVHGADLLALLGDALMLQVARRPASKDEKRISSIFRKYIVNFVKFGSPGSQDEWPRYVLEYPNVHEICYSEEANSNCNARSINRDIVFWLQYLPQLANSVFKTEQSGQIQNAEDENRLRGGVMAMCGISVILLLLLCISLILLHRGRTYRAYINDDGTHL